MSDFVRVKDKTTGHEFTVRHPDLSKVAVIDKPAVDRNGRPLEAKPKTSVAAKAAEKKSKTSTPGAEPAASSQEGSA